MIQSANAKIFLADQRGIDQTAWFRSLTTFNTIHNFQEHKEPFGALYAINDTLLDAGCTTQLEAAADSFTLLLPVMGAITYRIANGPENTIAAGQATVLFPRKQELVSITNPFDEGLVNYLQIAVKAGPTKMTDGQQTCSYQVNDAINSLAKLFPSEPGQPELGIYIGKFIGRGETTHYVAHKESGLFVFAIEGAFDVQGRLLHARDGLALWDMAGIEMEALSHDAILLVMEIPGAGY